jgi:hypothetical protein
MTDEAASPSGACSAANLVQDLGKQRKRDHSAHGKECNPRRLEDSPKRVSEDGRGKSRGGLGLFSHAARKEVRLSSSGEKRVRIAFGQQFAGAIADLGTHERELRVQLPRLDVLARGRLTLIDQVSAGPGGRRPPWEHPRLVFELEMAFNGDGGHSTKCYRRSAYLT